jgi:hypothetical protein
VAAKPPIPPILISDKATMAFSAEEGGKILSELGDAESGARRAAPRGAVRQAGAWSFGSYRSTWAGWALRAGWAEHHRIMFAKVRCHCTASIWSTVIAPPTSRLMMIATVLGIVRLPFA